MAATQQVRFLVISDTHEYDYTNVTTPSKHGFRGDAIPTADVVLHCGDLTENGSLESYSKVIEQLGTIDAELKLVIAGNHDLSLHKDHFLQHGGTTTEHEEAVKLWTHTRAKELGIHYLEEGMHTFTLRNGATFTLYASPWTPKYGLSAFQYKSNEDRYNLESPAWATNIGTAQSRILGNTKIDIMMTHGPPKYILDNTEDGSSAGCEHLRRAVCHARPRLHCFGHVHTGWGAQKVSWNTSAALKVGEEDACLQPSPKEFVGQNSSRKRGYATARTEGMVHGEQTLFVNAAIEDKEWTNAPWLVTLDLPVKEEVRSLPKQHVEDLTKEKSLTEQSVVGAMEVTRSSPKLTKRKFDGEGSEDGTMKKMKWV